MLITLSGTITHKLENALVVETGGLGYEVWMPAHELESMRAEHTVSLWVYEHVREDIHELYGFDTDNQRNLFIKLLGISGVGPKAALAILSVGSFGNVSQAIASGDIALLQSAPGVGKRTAERIVMELKTSVGLTTDVGTGSGVQGDGAAEALQSLGYSAAAAAAALVNVPHDLSEEERVKQALKGMSHD